jgi:putative peptide zinc metalloprotease protein
MNIFEAPAEVFKASPRKQAGWPKLVPGIVAREHVQAGAAIVALIVPAGEGYYHVTPLEWRLLQLFDGERSFLQVAEAYQAAWREAITEQDVIDIYSYFEKTELFYKSPSQKSAALLQALLRERHHGRKRTFDLKEITLLRWDPDRYLTRIHSRFYWVYSSWFTSLTLVGFAFTFWVFASHWNAIWRDTFEYYVFADKGLRDLAEFWVLFGIMVFFHESAHGLTCKHYGGEVHRMGFMLMFLCPAFFCDVSEAWVYATKWQRIATMMAGIWVELVLCTFASVLWWGTPTGMWVHDLAYKLILVSGVGVIVLNLNPLLKLDGYYILGELIGMTDLKERSSSYVSSWVNSIFGLDHEREYLSRRHRWGFIAYAVLSSLYCYLLLFVVVRWTYNIAAQATVEWAFVPALAMTWVVFKTDLKALGRFMAKVYGEKQGRVRAWFTPVRSVALGAAVLVLLLVPIWRDTVQARFVLEPAQRAFVRAEVPGRVMALDVAEGQRIAAGTAVARLQNLHIESEAEESGAQYRVASARVIQTQMQYAVAGRALMEKDELQQQEQGYSFARAVKERDEWQQADLSRNQQRSKLQLTSPISGVVTSPRLRDLVGSYVQAGETIAEVEDLSRMHARLFVPEYTMRDVQVGEPVSVHVEGSFQRQGGTLVALQPARSTLQQGLGEKTQYEGIQQPLYFVATVEIVNPGDLRSSMVGDAKILVGRRSVAAFALRFARDMLARRIW